MNRHRFAVACPLAGVVIAAVLTGCGGDEPGAPTKTVTVTAEPTTVEAEPTAAEPTEPEPTETEQIAAPPATTEAPAPAAPSSWIMPSAVGMNLQDAQDGLQALTGNPLFITLSEDATGQDRNQILDANWKVCAQTPGPGESFTETTQIVFSSVKLNESC